MAERTVPIFPCRSIDRTAEFYEALGFELLLRQTRPNHFVQLRRGDLELQFYGWKQHDPAASMHMCYVPTDDVDLLYEAFRGGLKAAFGRVPSRGLPRLGPLKDMSYGVRQFLMTDPDGIQLRVGQPIAESFEHVERPKEKFARAVHDAALLGDSKEDPEAAARVLDRLLEADDVAKTPPQLVQVLVMRADMAVRVGDLPRAEEMAARARSAATDLAEGERAAVRDDLDRLADLESEIAAS
ncbi:bleomycin resistance protein [Actinomadura sp. 21ATH]|uniref:bleomycin resistance protein n=1 Tax=Actinomadura sp. 21ATH TaxID=1735444 RepID=UPI0035C03296